MLLPRRLALDQGDRQDAARPFDGLAAHHTDQHVRGFSPAPFGVVVEGLEAVGRRLLDLRGDGALRTPGRVRPQRLERAEVGSGPRDGRDVARTVREQVVEHETGALREVVGDPAPLVRALGVASDGDAGQPLTAQKADAFVALLGMADDGAVDEEAGRRGGGSASSCPRRPGSPATPACGACGAAQAWRPGA